MEFTDNIILDASPSRRIKDKVNGFLKIVGNPVALAGVAPYRESEVIEKGDPDTIVQVYKPFHELVNSKDTFKHKPIIKDHEWIGKKGTKNSVDGAIGSDVWDDGKKQLLSDIVIYNPNLIDAIERGECTELSPGYKAEIKKEPGEYEGVHYDYVMKNFEVNHVAVVNKGRAGHELRLLDKDIEMDVKDVNESMASPNILYKEDNRKATDDIKNVIDSDQVYSENNIKTEAAKEPVFTQAQVREMMDSITSEFKKELSSQKEQMQKFFDEQMSEYKNNQKELLKTKAQVELNIGRPIMDECSTVEDIYRHGYEILTGVSLSTGLHAETAYKTALVNNNSHFNSEVNITDSDLSENKNLKETMAFIDSINVTPQFIRN